MRLAEAIADGKQVDWQQAVADDPSSSDSIDALRVIQSLGEAHTPPVRPIPAAWGSLTIHEKIGEGAFGEVYRAFDPNLQRDVALKLLSGERALDESASARFLEEARRLARVRHPNVVVVHGADLRERRVGMWTDLVRGRTLEQILLERGPFGEREAANVGIDLCRALAAVHAAKLVHRDVKTQNVMRDDKGEILLMDFGSVGPVSSAGEGAESRPYGTPLATAPEVLASGAATTRSDIYSLGVLLFRLVTGKYPVEASTYEELIEKHQRREKRWLREERPDLSPGFVRAVERALDPDPKARYSGPGEMERALAWGRQHKWIDQLFGWLPPLWRAPAAVGAGLILIAGLFYTKRSLFPDPVPPPVVVTPAEKGVLTAHATLYRDRGAESPAEQLLPGARVRPGDALYLELWGEDSMTVYVLNEDARGNVYVLFPLPGFDLQNPLPGQGRHRLPGTRDGAPENWQVTSIGEREDLIVIASREPLPGVEQELASIPAAKPGEKVQPHELSAGARARLRGIGGTEQAEAEPVEQRSSRLVETLTSLASDPARAKDIWVWQTKLENPANP
ncbi:MAG TPA: protein kinase [Candidatus Eisenbacteria bacterium]|nr:protein kinase [Candidatus Eisenbacteria bacterium]